MGVLEYVRACVSICVRVCVCVRTRACVCFRTIHTRVTIGPIIIAST